MPRVTIKPRTGKHTEWVRGKPIIYTSNSPPFEVSEKTLADFRGKFDLLDALEVAPTEHAESELLDPGYDGDAELFDVPSMKITEVLTAVEGGQLSAKEALNQETGASKPRQSLVKEMASILKSEEVTDDSENSD